MSAHAEIRAGGLVWTPADADPWASPIGWELALEQVRREELEAADTDEAVTE